MRYKRCALLLLQCVLTRQKWRSDANARNAQRHQKRVALPGLRGRLLTTGNADKKATNMSSTHLQQKKTRVKEARKETKKVRSQGDAFMCVPARWRADYMPTQRRNQSLEVSRALSHNRIEPDDEEFKVLFLQRRVRGCPSLARKRRLNDSRLRKTTC